MSFKSKRIFNHVEVTFSIHKELPNLQTRSPIYTVEKFTQSKNFNFKFTLLFQAWILMNLSWTTPSYHVIVQVLVLMIKTTDMPTRGVRISDNSWRMDQNI